MNCTDWIFITEDPIAEGDLSSASVFHTRITRSSPLASTPARCLPSGEIVKLDIFENAASCWIEGTAGLAWTMHAPTARITARAGCHVREIFNMRSSVGCEIARYKKENATSPRSDVACAAALHRELNVHEVRAAEVVEAAVQRRVTPAVGEALRDLRQVLVRQVAHAGGDRPLVGGVLQRQMVGLVARRGHLVGAGRGIFLEERVARHLVDPVHPVSDPPCLPRVRGVDHP